MIGTSKKRRKKESKSRYRWLDGILLCLQHFVLSFETSNGKQWSGQLVTLLSKEGMTSNRSVQVFKERSALHSPFWFAIPPIWMGLKLSLPSQAKYNKKSLAWEDYK